MNKFYYPAKPHRINQVWGLRNPLYEQFGFSRHNGLDIALGVDKKLYCPFPAKVVRVGNQPTGGGIFIGILSLEKYIWPDGKEAYALMDFLHLERPLVTELQRLNIGEEMAIADNTGLSTGPHTHIQLRRVESWPGTPIDKNDANDSIDPELYWNGLYAKDYNEWTGYVPLLTIMLDQLKELSEKLKGRK